MPALTRKTALVTGAASGIGEAIARRLAADGAQVLLLDQNRTAAESAAAAIGHGAAVIAADVASYEEMRSVFHAIERLDILVNNAGIAHVGNVLETTPTDMDRLYSVNVRGVYHGLHFGVPLLLASRGVALNVCSVAAKLGIADRFAYSMTKGAVLSMTLSVARDFVSSGVRCNCICPARVHTPFVDGFLAKNYPGSEAAMLDKLSQWQPMRRMGKPEEIASLAAFLCSDDAAFITGSAYDIDGGVTLLR